jgi:hypothetical protein
MQTPNQPDLDNETMRESEFSESDRWWERHRARCAELQSAGFRELQASDTAMLEEQIRNWPTAWGEDLIVVLYGDFDTPKLPLEFPSLGIIAEYEQKETLAKGARCALLTRVKLIEHSIAGLEDAARRLNLLLDAGAAWGWGNFAAGWWSSITHNSMGCGSGGELNSESIEAILNHLQKYPPEVQRKLKAAMHWIREPKQLVMTRYRRDEFQVYAGYWNAFECLVDAVCILVPQPRVSKLEREEEIASFLASRNGKPSLADIQVCFRKYVDGGFVTKASHALRACFGGKSDGYIWECFEIKPAKERLYNIRNSINHGEIDTDSLSEFIRVSDKNHRLWAIVFGMLGLLLPVHRPLDSRSPYQCESSPKTSGS